MTVSQLNLHWYLWRQVREGLIEQQKMTPAKADEHRHVLYRKALGHDVSMVNYQAVKNGDFDKIKAVFLAYIAPADLLAQMDQIDQPAKRIEAAIDRAHAIMEDIGVDADDVGEEAKRRHRENYVGVIIKHTFHQGSTWSGLTDQDAAIIVGILERRRQQLVRKAAATAERNPF